MMQDQPRWWCIQSSLPVCCDSFDISCDQRPTTRGKSSSVQYCSQQAIESRGVSPQPAPTISEHTTSITRAALFLSHGTLEECGGMLDKRGSTATLLPCVALMCYTIHIIERRYPRYFID
eukprot:GHVU01026957.1.p2 GENE.GHVU01026957.1~~GHVU01026957.1.p2  ORF type:complete len:120 (+),score=5.19 GHVU01026957.1:684-1043(+)